MRRPPTALNVAKLGQVFTPAEVVEFMLGLRQRRGRTLEPSAGNGAFLNCLHNEQADCLGIEIDATVASQHAQIGDFFDLPGDVRFDTIIGNPPYVRFQDIPDSTRNKLTSPLFDKRSNLFLFFIEKCIRHLAPGGELIFIVPREFAKLTAARKLNHWLATQGSITHFVETGDVRIFGGHTPNCVIFRFEKDRMDRTMADGRRFTEINGQLMFLRDDYRIRFADLFDVRVGAVSGADHLFAHPEGNLDFVCSKTADTGETRPMFYGVQNDYLAAHKSALLGRRIRRFTEQNWWSWGRDCPRSEAPRIYVNGRTRKAEPFFLHDCPRFDGSILGLFPRNPHLTRRDLLACTQLLNKRVNWQELGFICDGRFLFTQRSLQTCLLPDEFSRFLPPDLLKDVT